MKITTAISIFAISFSAALFAGCKKEEAPPPQPATNAANTAPQPPKPAPAPQPSMAAVAQDYDATLFLRSLEFVKGRIAMKDYEAARQSLKAIESQQLNPQQRQMLESVKAQIPRS